MNGAGAQKSGVIELHEPMEFGEDRQRPAAARRRKPPADPARAAVVKGIVDNTQAVEGPGQATCFSVRFHN